jgi:SHS2 domain-containing protein
MTEKSGYREIEHTADWQLEVWGSGLSELFSQAAQGMLSLANVTLDTTHPAERSLDLTADDLESLLVAFLSELLYFGEEQGLAFDQFSINIQPGRPARLQAELQGGKILGQSKEIKAVTYHNLEILQTEGLFRVRIVFDV